MSNARPLDAIDLAILEHLAAGARAVAPLRAGIPRETLYGRLRQHVAAGWVRKVKKGIWESLPAGGEALAAARADGAPAPQDLLSERIPHLALAPTLVHRALIVLAVAAVILRTHRVGAAHHAAFLVFGPPRRWKSWLAQLMCYLCGLNPKNSLLYLPTESGGALIQRKGAKGQITTRRPATLEKFVGLDEIGRRLKPAVIEVLRLLLHGELEIADEAGTIALPAVPMCLANPKPGRKDASLPERLGIDEGALRRSVPVNLADVEIPAAIMTEGDERLERACKLGAIDFPPPPDPDWIPRAETQRYLAQLLDSPDRCADVDVTMVAKFATGLSALLPQRLALREALRAYVTAVATLGWARPDWEALLPPAESAPEPAAAPGPSEASGPNPFDLATTLAPLQHELDAMGLSPQHAGELLGVVRRLGPARIAALDSLAGTLKRDGLKLDRVRRILEAGSRLASAAGIPAAEAATTLRKVSDGLVAECARADAHGNTPADLPALIRQWAKGGRLKLDWRRHRDRVRGEAQAAERELARLTADVNQMRTDGEALAKFVLQRKEQYLEVDQGLASATELRDERLAEAEEAKHHRAQAEAHAIEYEQQIAFAHDAFRVLAGELDANGAWVGPLRRALERAETLDIPIALGPEAQQVVLRALQKHSPDAIVPREELDDYLARIRLQERKRIHAELAPLVEVLGSVPSALAPILEAVRDAATRLVETP